MPILFIVPIRSFWTEPRITICIWSLLLWKFPNVSLSFTTLTFLRIQATYFIEIFSIWVGLVFPCHYSQVDFEGSSMGSSKSWVLPVASHIIDDGIYTLYQALQSAASSLLAPGFLCLRPFALVVPTPRYGLP